MLDKLKESFNKSNRDKHFYYSIVLGILFTAICPISMAIGMELKDKWKGGIFDYEDLGWSMIGGVIGQFIQIILILII